MMPDIRVMLTTICCASLLATLGGCQDNSTSTSNNAVAGGSSSSPASSVTITGTPRALATVNAGYDFTPIVKADAGAELSFAVSNQPSWATFNASTGKLSGTPTANDVGDYKNISIMVNDGSSHASLSPFSIAVKPASEVATITWLTPAATSTAAGIAGYHVYYGAAAASMTHVIEINDPTETSYVISNLASGTWYFAMTSYDTSQVESDRSTTVMVTL